MANLRSYIIKEEIIFDDESNPTTSPYDIIWPVTVLDAVIDQNTLERITLRQILAEIFKRLDEGQEELQIDYPVRSTRGFKYRDDPLRPEFLGDVIITRESLDLEKVDNTDDMHKPMSEYQQNWVETYVEQQISNIPPTDLSSLTSHLSNFGNPHRVTFNQINTGGKNGIVTDLIEAMIDTHDKAGTTHHDLRNLIKDLTSIVNSNNVNTTNYIADLETKTIDHINQGGQHHIQLFNSKENKLNKVDFFSSSYVNAPGVIVTDLDHIHYPSTLAVANYIEARLQRPVGQSVGGGTSSGGNDGNSLIADLAVREHDSSLPAPSASNVGQAYLVKSLKDYPGWAGLVVCRQIAGSYQWVTEKYIPIANFDPDYFEEGPNGWKFKPQTSTDDSLKDLLMTMTHVSNAGTGDSFYQLDETVFASPFPGGSRTRTVFKFGELAVKNIIYDDSIGNAAIFNRHMTANSVNGGNISNLSISTDHLQNRSVTNVKLAVNSILGEHLPIITEPGGTTSSWIIQGGHILPDTIGASKIIDRSLTNIKFSNLMPMTVKGRMTPGEGVMEDIPFKTLALALAATGATVPIAMSSVWPTSISDYPIGSMFYNSALPAIGVRISNTVWRYITLGSTANVTSTS